MYWEISVHSAQFDADLTLFKNIKFIIKMCVVGFIESTLQWFQIYVLTHKHQSHV